MTIALFGTSADPPTQGHQAILKGLAQQYDGVAVWASNNPFKTHQTPLEHRLRMLELLIQPLQPDYPHLGLYPQLGYSRSLDSLRAARQHWPHEPFMLVVGSDLIGQMPKWYRIQTLFQETDLLVVPRSGYPIEPEAIAILKELGAKVAIADLQIPAVSSTAYRERRESQVIAPPIQDYIHRQQLYSSIQVS